MTGPEHYREAERLLGDHGTGNMMVTPPMQITAAAQVHATLAQAAATAIGSADLPSGDWDDWRHVASAGHAGRIPGSERPAKP